MDAHLYEIEQEVSGAKGSRLPAPEEVAGPVVCRLHLSLMTRRVVEEFRAAA